jgi:hypothetical protein
LERQEICEGFIGDVDRKRSTHAHPGEPVATNDSLSLV